MENDINDVMQELNDKFNATKDEYYLILNNKDLREIRYNVGRMPKIRTAFHALMDARQEHGDLDMIPIHPVVMNACLLYRRMFIDECNSRIKRK